MKQLLYTYSEQEKKTNGVWRTYKTVRIYARKRDQWVQVANATDTYVDKFQLFMMTAESAKLLPRRAFEKHPSGGPKYGAPYLLKEAGIANVQEIY